LWAHAGGKRTVIIITIMQKKATLVYEIYFDSAPAPPSRQH
jgi:hypothetical protein